ncbi:hypothetical protein D3C87_1735230 [compost metagenome]
MPFANAKVSGWMADRLGLPVVVQQTLHIKRSCLTLDRCCRDKLAIRALQNECTVLSVVQTLMLVNPIRSIVFTNEGWADRWQHRRGLGGLLKW